MNLYPFSAIVGQAKTEKGAAGPCAINPAIGGRVDKRQKKGRPKRRRYGVLRPLCPRRLRKGFWNGKYDRTLCGSRHRVLRKTVFWVALTLQAIVSEKKKKFLPGLLASAHQGILYIDEVNLLADHILVDILLDVAASGINTVQREGISESHAARFMLIGAMNPEEGNLRPQFLDHGVLG
ncbi:ATP-binding protein [Paucibacter sp. O1-1]|nr:ATP-binding protein [Paucibacter sp. O1-1]MDA3825987.1 ATP-binding protein [Paucibacter sp. O1-1]